MLTNEMLQQQQALAGLTDEQRAAMAERLAAARNKQDG